MNLNISGHHVDMTDAMREFVTNKLQRLERHLDQLIDAEVILHVEKIRHRAEAKLNVNGAILFAEATEDDMYKAVDCLIDKLDKQVLKYKEKRKDHHNKEAVKKEVTNIDVAVD